MLIVHTQTLLSFMTVIAVLLGANIPYLFTCCSVQNGRLGTTTTLAFFLHWGSDIAPTVSAACIWWAEL